MHLEFQLHWFDPLQSLVDSPLFCLHHHNLMSVELHFILEITTFNDFRLHKKNARKYIWCRIWCWNIENKLPTWTNPNQAKYRIRLYLVIQTTTSELKILNTLFIDYFFRNLTKILNHLSMTIFDKQNRCSFSCSKHKPASCQVIWE